MVTELRVVQFDMKAIVFGKHVRRTSFIKRKPSSFWEWTNVTNYYHYVIIIFFRFIFLSSHTLHVIPCNFRLLFYSSIHTVYSWFFPINLMKTGVGHSKYCIPHPFSCCLISLCSSLFYFDSIFIVFDWSRSYFLIQRWATLIVHGFCGGFSSLGLHCFTAANFSRNSKFVYLSEVAHRSFCVKFSGLIIELRIPEKSYAS